MISKITLCITLLSIVAENTIFADDIKKISPCIAELNNGKRIDLTSIANEKTFRLKLLNAKILLNNGLKAKLNLSKMLYTLL